ncbi:4-hydroxy-tetrahydrodipicolinate reductase [Sporosarcina sp. ANT_H38]|uniref:4-hydroxy-tetrahydrodipicolinate reductase n=1 Tax=Sporosarcina sp. ANT_H38 TaxID=2597358 RepID=UPI0011F14582|nr:4-hydroxy-tetrahydrodipicolinate reductase [Sporosarcina sp. ANT_H38]KAA0966119.1 4-hydroxy-tetrahydrodipicolinate reductase [Sporosarcina sp. ANT_H38]
MTIKVAIAGARGRLGSAALTAIMSAPNMKVVAALDYKYEGQYLHETEVNNMPGGIPIYTSLENLAAANKPDVMLDLTDPNAVFRNVHDALSLGIRPVVGTSGLSMDNIALLTELAAKNQVGGIIAPNFSIGAVLMMKFSAIAARYLDNVEILEMHHDKKVDAPSGTAVKTAEMIKAVRESHKQGHPDEQEHQVGARGADFDGMKIHSIRLPGLLAHQQVLLGGEGELLTIRHDSFDRSSFMPGILMAIHNVMERQDLVYGLENIID